MNSLNKVTLIGNLGMDPKVIDAKADTLLHFLKNTSRKEIRYTLKEK